MILALLVVVAMALSVMFLLTGTAEADHLDTWPSSNEANQASFWENWGAQNEGETDWVCQKTDNPQDDGTPYELGNPPQGYVWRLLVVKAGNDHNDLYWNPTPGDEYAATGQGAGGWSHVIECRRPFEEDTTTTSEPTTTTSEDTTTTTVEDTTTTSVEETTTTSVEDTTTTSVEETTTTSVEETTTTSEDTTTTTVEVDDSSTTTVEDSTTSSVQDPEVLDTTITAPEETTSSSIEDEVLAEELPFTGIESGALAIIAGVLGTMGGLVILSARKLEE